MDNKENEKKFADTVGELSREFLIPYPVSIVLGTEKRNYELFKRDIEDLDPLSVGQLRDLRAGIARRKRALSEVLAPETYEALGIASMGQKHSERLAHFIWDKAMYRIQS